MKGKLNAISLLEKPDSDERLVFVSGENATVYGFSTDTHEIMDIWSTGDGITSMDCVNLEDGGIVFGFGTVNGKVFLRLDWEESPRYYECAKPILDCKFSTDSYYFIVACEDNHIYVFTLNNNSYF